MFADTFSNVVKSILFLKECQDVLKHWKSRMKEVKDFKASLRIECTLDTVWKQENLEIETLFYL